MSDIEMTDEEILEIDFYDLFGSWSVFHTDNEKIEYYKSVFKTTKKTDGENN